jgi:hypothetical protein
MELIFEPLLYVEDLSSIRPPGFHLFEFRNSVFFFFTEQGR